MAKLDAARGSTPKSQFVRDGVAAYLRKHGFQVENAVSSAPDRKGKGGPRPSSKLTPAEARLLKKGTASGR